MICLEIILTFQYPALWQKKLYEIKDKKKNNELVKAIKDKRIDLENEIKKMSEDEMRIEEPDKMLWVVQKNFDFNEETQKQQGLWLKRVTPSQILSTLPISLAQLKAGNKSEKLKNEIRQLLYSLCRSRKLTKNTYENLVDII